MHALDRAWEMHDRSARGLSGSARDHFGAVFTPRPLAVALARRTFGPLTEGGAPSALDPACGAGALLLGALEWAAEERPVWLRPWLSGLLSGWERDAAIAARADAALREAARALGLPGGARVEMRDALAEPELATAAFDAVLANPPWVSYSGRQAVSLPSMERERLAGRFAAFRSWPSTHAAFGELCVWLARGDRGRVGMLLPLQAADLARYGGMRCAMSARLRPHPVVDLGEAAFPGVVEPAGMFLLGPGRGEASTAPWPLEGRATDVAGFDSHRPLPASSFGDVGVHTGNAARLLLVRGREEGAAPIREGRDIKPFRLEEPRLSLRRVALPEGCYARVDPEEKFRRTRIVLRQTADRPVAARHDPQHLFRNSVLACFGAPGHDDDFLVGYFNSGPVARRHRALYRDARQQAFPQLKISHLRGLPVPSRERAKTAYGDVAEIARCLRGAEGEEAERLRCALDEAVARALLGT